MSLKTMFIKYMFGGYKRYKKVAPPEKVRRYDDISYGPTKKWNTLDLYCYQRSSNIPLPVIINVHGGAWVSGSKESSQEYCLNLAKRGFAVVNFNYRLAPKYKFPTPLEDTNMVVAWVQENAEKFGLDKEKILMIGDSAGAHIAALYACLLTNPKFGKAWGIKVNKAYLPKAMGLNCGAYDLKAAAVGERGNLMQIILPEILGRNYSETLAKFANPREQLTKDFPPCFIMSANEDFLREQAPILAKDLQKLGVACMLKIYGDDDNRLGHVFQNDDTNLVAKAATDEELAYLKQFIVEDNI